VTPQNAGHLPKAQIKHSGLLRNFITVGGWTLGSRIFGFGRIAFPYILFIALAAMLSGMLHSLGRFAVAAAAPVLANILLIAAMVGAHLLGGNVALALIWTIPLAGVAQLGLVALAVTRAGFPLRLRRPRLTPDLRRLVRISAPSILAGSVRHVNVIAGQLVASFFDRAIGWLFAAARLHQLPLGLIGAAIGVILLPNLSRKLRAGNEIEARATFSRATELAMALTLPCVVAFLVIPLPVVSVLFERGAFRPADSAAVALAVAIGAFGLPAFILSQLQQSLFFARADTRRPFHYAIIAMGVNLVAAVGLALLIGWTAPALAQGLSAWVLAWLLYRGSRSMGDAARLDKRFYRRIWRIGLASLLMGAELWAAQLWLAEGLITPGWRYLWLAVLILSGIFTYFGSGLALKAFTIEDFRRSLTKRSKSEAAL